MQGNVVTATTELYSGAYECPEQEAYVQPRPPEATHSMPGRGHSQSSSKEAGKHVEHEGTAHRLVLWDHNLITGCARLEDDALVSRTALKPSGKQSLIFVTSPTRPRAPAEREWHMVQTTARASSEGCWNPRGFSRGDGKDDEWIQLPSITSII